MPAKVEQTEPCTTPLTPCSLALQELPAGGYPDLNLVQLQNPPCLELAALDSEVDRAPEFQKTALPLLSLPAPPLLPLLPTVEVGFSQDVQNAMWWEGVTDLEDLKSDEILHFLEKHKFSFNFSLRDIRQLRQAAKDAAKLEEAVAVQQRGAKRALDGQKLTPKAPTCPPPSWMLRQARGVPRMVERFPERTTTRRIEVGDLYYSQKKMSSTFRDGRSFDDLVDALDNGEVDPETAPFLKLEVVERPWSGKYRLFCSDNRRLWCLKKHKENMGDLVFVHCHVMRHQELKQARTHKRHFDTKNGGIQIKIRDR